MLDLQQMLMPQLKERKAPDGTATLQALAGLVAGGATPPPIPKGTPMSGGSSGGNTDRRGEYERLVDLMNDPNTSEEDRTYYKERMAKLNHTAAGSDGSLTEYQQWQIEQKEREEKTLENDRLAEQRITQTYNQQVEAYKERYGEAPTPSTLDSFRQTAIANEQASSGYGGGYDSKITSDIAQGKTRAQNTITESNRELNEVKADLAKLNETYPTASPHKAREETRLNRKIQELENNILGAERTLVSNPFQVVNGVAVDTVGKTPQAMSSKEDAVRYIDDAVEMSSVAGKAYEAGDAAFSDMGSAINEAQSALLDGSMTTSGIAGYLASKLPFTDAARAEDYLVNARTTGALGTIEVSDLKPISDTDFKALKTAVTQFNDIFKMPPNEQPAAIAKMQNKLIAANEKSISGYEKRLKAVKSEATEQIKDSTLGLGASEKIRLRELADSADTRLKSLADKREALKYTKEVANQPFDVDTGSRAANMFYGYSPIPSVTPVSKRTASMVGATPEDAGKMFDQRLPEARAADTAEAEAFKRNGVVFAVNTAKGVKLTVATSQYGLELRVQSLLRRFGEPK